MRPLIGITTFMVKHPKKMYTSVSSNYVDVIKKAGGTPILLPVIEDPEVLEDYLTVIDGLLLTGGDEGINPQLYGENPVRELECICPERDEYETIVLRCITQSELINVINQF